MPSSFLSEHSCEYHLVPKFLDILETQYQNSIPIFFWHSREGGVRSRNSLSNILVKIVAVYARRPKFINNRDQEVLVKFNQVLFDRAGFMKEIGIPVFAGVPFISTLEEFTRTAPFVWFKIDPTMSEHSVTIQDIDSGLSSKEILDTIEEECASLTWPNAIDQIKALRRRQDYNTLVSFFTGGLYKPVYFIIPQKLDF